MAATLKIIFLGTPEFAVASLEALVTRGYRVVAVVTAPDQPSGRGQRMQSPPVKVFAEKHGLPVLQPEKLKHGQFLEDLRAFQADLFIVVAFRMLPEAVWKMPPLGTFNLHASLLPQYRGAAPIHHAVMNGETTTGLTTFFLKQDIDTGEIIFREEINILPDETTGELHDRMKTAGAGLVIKTVDAIAAGKVVTTSQMSLADPSEPLKTAPKIFREDGLINWHRTTSEIYNKIRGLNPVPGAFTNLISPAGETWQLKIFRAEKKYGYPDLPPGMIITGEKHALGISTSDGILILEEVQLAGKRRMKTDELLRGFRIETDWKVG